MAMLIQGTLSKQHLFNFEMKYRRLSELGGYQYEFDTKGTAEIRSELNYMLQYFNRYFKTDEEILEFLNDYKDVIDWDYFIKLENGWIFESVEVLDKIISIALPYLDTEAWEYITCDRHSLPIEELKDFYRKYKDNIYWDNIEYSILDFDIDFIREMRDYIPFERLFEYFGTEFTSHVETYVLDHLDEVLDYRKEDE